jgi:hypothetical protein
LFFLNSTFILNSKYLKKSKMMKWKVLKEMGKKLNPKKREKEREYKKE